MARKSKYAALYTLRSDGRYQASYTDDKGRHYLYNRDPERLWQKLNDIKKEKPRTFRSMAERWKKEHWEEIGFKTAEAYTAPLRRIEDQFGDQTEVTAAEISAYLSQLAGMGFSRRSVQMHRDILSMIFNHAIVTGETKTNPCAAVRMPKNLSSSVREIPPDDAIEAVKAGKGKPFGLFALICLYAGLRRGEALALEYKDIDRESHVIHVTKSVEFLGNAPHIKEPKTKAGVRMAPLLDVLEREIPKGEGLIFPRQDGGLLTKTQYRKRWTAYCKEIGYKITAHQLRHGFATILYEADVQDKDAQEFLGHSNITTTRNIYTHIRQRHREDTVKQLNQFLKSGDG